MAANLIGLLLSGSEAQFVKNIVNIIYSKLARKRFHLPLNLVRMDTRYEEINSWIKQHDAKFLVICGMGGSGKTTLARYIVYSNSDKFENISMMEHIGSKWKEPHHLLGLQEKLLEGLLGNKKREIANISNGTCMIQEALEKNKALIVLDDIADHQQLVKLLGSGNINKESKIIVTTREANLLESRSWKCREHNMKLLDADESLELLSLHAFGSKTPVEGYKELAQQVVRYCEGNLLALEVLGSSLSEDISIKYWESSLNSLKTNIHSGIDRVLTRSYDSLHFLAEKELFLHIACFFNGADMDYVIKIYEKDCSAVSSIKTLTKRCLLSISPNQTLVMHPLLQELGRSIVLQESPKEQSRVWQNTDSYDLLRKGTGSKKVEGLALDKQMLREENDAFQAESFNVIEMPKPSFVGEGIKYGNTSETRDTETKAPGIFTEEPIVDQDLEFTSSSLKEKMSFTMSEFIDLTTKEAKIPASFILDHCKPPPILMDSGSSPSIMDSFGANALSYDVFISFKGEDTRKTFTSHLYFALARAGIHTFKSDDELHLEEPLLDIERRIKPSKVSIIVFSEGYAKSPKCLDELSLILEQRTERNHFVLPVFIMSIHQMLEIKMGLLG